MAKGKKSKDIKEIKEKPEKSQKKARAAEQEMENTGEEKKTAVHELKQEFINDVADFFKVFGDATRVRMLYILLNSEMCVGDIAETLEMTQSAVSHQLRVLRQSNLVKYRKDGKTVYYSLDDDHVKTVLQQGVSHIGHKKGYEEC